MDNQVGAVPNRPGDSGQSPSPLQRTVDKGNCLTKIVLLGHASLYQFARMQHGAVIASSKCVANFVKRRLGKLARQIHRNLPRKSDAGRAPFACHIGYAHIKVLGYAPLNLFDGDGMPSFFLQDVLQQMLDHFLGKLLSAE